MTQLTGQRVQQVAREIAESLPEVSFGYPFTPRLAVYKVGGHVFLIVTEDPDEQIITIKCDPPHAEALIREHATIGPGRYLDKHHWVSISSGPGITAALVEDLVRESFELVLEQAPRHERDRIHTDLDDGPAR